MRTGFQSEPLRPYDLWAALTAITTFDSQKNIKISCAKDQMPVQKNAGWIQLFTYKHKKHWMQNWPMHFYF